MHCQPSRQRYLVSDDGAQAHRDEASPSDGRNGRIDQKICPHLLVQYTVNNVATGVSVDTVRNLL